jgi:hypothetical protein
VIRVRLRKAIQKHQSEHGGLQRPGQRCHLWSYHDYLWDWMQTQVNTSLDTTSMLTITTLVQYLRLEHLVYWSSGDYSKVRFELSQIESLNILKEEPGFYSRSSQLCRCTKSRRIQQTWRLLSCLPLLSSYFILIQLGRRT